MVTCDLGVFSIIQEDDFPALLAFVRLFLKDTGQMLGESEGQNCYALNYRLTSCHKCGPLHTKKARLRRPPWHDRMPWHDKVLATTCPPPLVEEVRALNQLKLSETLNRQDPCT